MKPMITKIGTMMEGNKLWDGGKIYKNIKVYNIILEGENG